MSQSLEDKALLLPTERKDLAISYYLWCLSFVGICGVQRIYLGHTGLGILMLFTFGFCGLGQVLDLFLLPDAVDQANSSIAKVTTNYETNYDQLRKNRSNMSNQQLETAHKDAAASTTNKDIDLTELLKNAKDAVNRTDNL